jgi:hypothetical protein
VNRTQRVSLVTLVLATAVAGVLGLVAFGARSQGPLAQALADVGSAVGGAEGRVVRRVRGAGRAQQLRWFASMRADSARLRNPDLVLLGAYDDGLPRTLQGVVELENHLGTAFPLIQIYTAWGDKPEQQFPIQLVRAISDLGSVPVVTWEPWLTDFENRSHPHLPLRHQRDRGGLAAIARGEYDFYLDEWAGAAAEWGKPIFVRWGHEMNDPYRYPWGPQNNKAEDYIAAWRHVVQRFRQAGANNVIWVWSPHVAYEYPEAFYPGDDVVDWVATGALNYGTVARWSDWWSFEEIYTSKREHLTRWKKPVMIAEFGTLAVGGDRNAWFREALSELPHRHPEIKALLFFNVASDATATQQSLDWSFQQDSTIVSTVAGAVASWRTAGTATPR